MKLCADSGQEPFTVTVQTDYGARLTSTMGCYPAWRLKLKGRSQAVKLRLQTATTKIGGVGKSTSKQQADGEIAALTFLAINHNAAVMGQFAEAVAEFSQRDIHRFSDLPQFGDFIRVAHIEEEIAVWLPSFRGNGWNISTASPTA